MNYVWAIWLTFNSGEPASLVGSRVFATQNKAEEYLKKEIMPGTGYDKTDFYVCSIPVE